MKPRTLRLLIRRSSFAVLFLLTATAFAQPARRRTAPVVALSTCAVPPATPGVCSEGAIGDGAAQSFASLSAAEVEAIVRAAAKALDVNTLTIAVVDRGGRPLALYRKPAAPATNDDLAVGVARTAAFFSHNQAPLSSRTVRFISGIHFPPGVTNASNAALYGIENTNRGCDFNVAFNAGQCLDAPRSLNGQPCHPFDTSGCGPGIVTGKQQPDDADPRAVNAGGIPLYRIVPPGLDRANRGVLTNGKLVGAIGVVGATGDPQRAELASVTGAFGSAATGIVPVPFYPLPEPGNVFIDGIRLPFLGPDLKLTFNADGLPNGVRRLGDTAPGQDNGTFVIAARDGGCAPNGYLVGPLASASGSLGVAAVDEIVQRAVAQSKRTRAAIRLPLSSYARMVIAVADLDGSILALYRMADATVFSIDVAVAKARNVIYFSSDPVDLPGVPKGTAVTNRTIGFGAQPLFPPGIDSDVFDVGAGPFYPLFLKDRANPCSQGSQPKTANQNGIVFFPGATPLYRNGQLIAGLGVSGDGVEQDDYVTLAAAGPLAPPENVWADRVKVRDVRLPMFKFPRQPEGVKECGGGPCS
jgi:uncharacterized protein GlcG (DUF336 family)